MIIKTKKVYYCEFCKKKSMMPNITREHERHCTLNPNRSCGFCNGHGLSEEIVKTDLSYFSKLKETSEWYKKQETIIERIKEKVKNCPACALAHIRFFQKKYGLSFTCFSYGEEVARWRDRCSHPIVIVGTCQVCKRKV